ncbi:adenosine deaminase [Aliikangiella coralliicola]|uniref:Adenosine deaminase n=1 Tax=Aliikangiella coralliicola TaxID=2592383 RepID=A0A545UFI9_9GAMM|nr:adenosine deaminase [Aliikangiella coralliicola]TQV88240.1 adenosine deaminase [Aliikangiella coralliicola]
MTTKFYNRLLAIIIVLFSFQLFSFNSFASNLDGMSREKMQVFIGEMPKAELHIHLEGTMSPETVAKLANRNKFNFFKTADEVRQSLSSRVPGLTGFLSHHNKQITVLQTEKDFLTTVYDFMEKCKENNIVYVEMFFDPQAHTSRGIDFDSMMKGILAGREAGQKAFGVKLNLIISINRERSVDSAVEMMSNAKPYKKYLLGLGIDSGPEEGNPPSKFKDVYAQAKKDGYFLTIHNDVDEKNSTGHIREAMDILKVDRLDHSLNAAEDIDLVAEIRRRDLCLTASPVQRGSDPEPQDIPRIRFLFQHGVCISLHSDDPGEFDSGYLTNLMLNFQQAGKFSKRDMVRLMLHAFKAAWLPDEEKKAYINSLKKWAAANYVNI